MATQLLYYQDVWQELHGLARKATKGYVAVAYLGTGAYKLMPLGKGSILVVDASDAAVRAGQTSAAELRRYFRAGVKIYSVENLHAKVFVFGRNAVVGSANVSQSSATQLVEAAVVTDDWALVKAARDFVRSIAVDPLSEASIDMLAKLPVKKPKPAPKAAAHPKGPKLNRLWVVSTANVPWDEAEEQAYEKGLPQAKAELDDATHEIEAIAWHGPDRFTHEVRPGHRVVEIFGSEKWSKVYPPAEVVHIQKVAPSGSRPHSKRIMTFLAREKRATPMSWTEFHKKAERVGLGYIKKTSVREIRGFSSGLALWSIFRPQR